MKFAGMMKLGGIVLLASALCGGARAAVIALDTSTSLADGSNFTPGSTYFVALQLNGSASSLVVNNINLGAGSGIDFNPVIDLTDGQYAVGPDGSSSAGMWQPGGTVSLTVDSSTASSLYSQRLSAGNEFSIDVAFAPGTPTDSTDSFTFQLYDGELTQLLYQVQLDPASAAATVPEPGSGLMLAGGGLLLWLRQRARSKQ